MIAIIIVNYNTREPLRRCLDSIRRERGDLALDVIVVDNASKDGSAEMVRADFPEVTLIAPPENTWFTGGNNLGYAHSTGELVFILNPDTVILPGTLPTLIQYMETHTVAAITCRLEYPDSAAVQATCSRVPRYLDLLLGYTFLGVLLAPLREKRRRAMWYDGWARDSTRAVEVIPGSCMLIRREWLRKVGDRVFDPALKLYFPEDDLCARLIAAGGAIHFVGEAVIKHEEHASVKQAQRLASRIYFDDLITFTRKHYGAAGALLLRGLIIPTRAAMEWVQRRRGERDRF
ncbi:MAG: glycosyltransferase family 2 protein [Anaerolinea sp.]|nr:glycosyltransferase family 2 protein [Anaerolinea sp.]